jgi:enamine deaminase RidA (YjgF/YER057c/UK114 family)
MVATPSFARIRGMTLKIVNSRGILLLLALSLAGAGGRATADDVAAKAVEKVDQPERKRLPGMYSIARVGLLPITASTGRALMHTEQCLAFGGAVSELEGADVQAQTEAIVKELDKEMKYFRSGLGQSMRVNVCIKRSGDRAAVQETITRHLEGAVPALCFVVGDLPVKEALVGIDAVGSTDYTTESYSGKARPVVSSRKGIWGARMAFLPAGRSIFVSGQSVKGDDVADSAAKTLEQLGETLKFLDRSWTNVVRVKTFLRNPHQNAKVVSEMIASRFQPKEFVPPQVFVEWTGPHDLEIELVVDGGAAMPELPRVEFLTPPRMKASPVFSRVVRVNHGRLIYTAGVTGGNGDDPLNQAKVVLGEIETSMAVFRADLRHLVKATYHLSDAAAGKGLDEVRKMLFDPKSPPAASKASVKGFGIPGATLMVDMIGVGP